MNPIEQASEYFTYQLALTSYRESTVSDVTLARKHAATAYTIYNKLLTIGTPDELEELTTELRLRSIEDTFRKINRAPPLIWDHEECKQLLLLAKIGSALESIIQE